MVLNENLREAVYGPQRRAQIMSDGVAKRFQLLVRNRQFAIGGLELGIPLLDLVLLASQGVCHLVESVGKKTDLVSRANYRPRIKITLPHAPRHRGKVDDRPGD